MPQKQFHESLSDGNASATNHSPFTLKATALRAQIISGTLILGVVTMSGVLLAVTMNPTEAQEPGALPFIGLAMWLVSTGLGIAWPMLGLTRVAMPANSASIVEHAIQNPDQPVDFALHPMLRAWNSDLIARAALLEGGVIPCLVLWLMTRELALLAAVGVSLSLMLITFPTLSRLCRWLEAKAE